MKLRTVALVLFLLAALAGAFVTRPASAGIVSVNSTQGRLTILANAPSTVTVVWQVVRFGGTAPANPGIISSPSGQLLVNGTPVGTVSRTLSRNAPGVGVAQETLIFTETFTVPRAVAYRSVQAGAPIILRRTFSDTLGASGGFPASATGTATIAPTGPGSEAFSVTRLELRFEDDTRVKVLPKGSRLRAVAELNTTGSGLITGQWEVATAATTPGTPVFQPFSLVRQAVAGGSRSVITSPPLPTRFEGNHLVRLRLTDPDLRFDEPDLQYYVTPESVLPERSQPQPMLVTSPGSGTPLTPATRFSWQAVPGTKLYKLEIYGAAAGPAEIVDNSATTTDVPLDRGPDTAAIAGLEPLTGVVLPGAVTEVQLRDHTLAHLAADRRYRWTVKAVDDKGAVIGASTPREIYKP